MAKTKQRFSTSLLTNGNKPKKNLLPPIQALSKEQQELRDTLEMLRLMDNFKMVMFYVLRNQGWGRKRIQRMNDKWNEYFIDISHGLFSIEDIEGVMLEETGLSKSDLMIQLPKGGEQ